MNQRPQIIDMALFSSKYSKKCITCEQFVNQTRLPINIIPLDTLEARAHAMNGSDIIIRDVPTLVVYYNDGTRQVFIKEQKIIPWLQNLVNSLQQSIQQTVQQTVQQQPQQPIPTKQPKSIPKTKKSRKKEPKVQEVPVELIFEDPPENNQPHNNMPNNQPHNNMPNNMITNANQQRPPPPPTQGLLTGGVSNARPSNKSVIEAAKLMLAERNKSLVNGTGE